MRMSSRHGVSLYLGLVVFLCFFSSQYVVGAESTPFLCGPIEWAKSDVPAGATNSNVITGSTSTIYWSVPHEDRSIQTTIQSYRDLEASQAFASGAPQRNENDHWQLTGGYGRASVYFRETANGNQYRVQGLHGGYNFVTVTTSTIFGTIPSLWTVPLEIHTVLFDQALAMINAKCSSDGCGEEIPLPQGNLVYFYEQNGMAAPLGASRPADMKPLFITPATGDGRHEGGTIHVAFCPFKGPVDIYLVFQYEHWDSPLYILNSQGQAEYLSGVKKIDPWRSNVTGRFTAEISGDFGGLFKSGNAPPLGAHHFLIGVAPHGDTSFQNLYVWGTPYIVGCETVRLPRPTGRNIYLTETVPVLAWTQDPDPSSVRPFAVGPVALGGEVTNLHYGLCPFECNALPCPLFDVYYGLYAPEYDLENIYFYNLEAGDFPAPNGLTTQALEAYLWKKVPVSVFLDMPGEAILEEGASIDPDPAQQTLMSIAIQGPQFFMAQLPMHALIQEPQAISSQEMDTFHLFAVSEHGVRDKYYAWVTTGPNLNIKDAIVQYWYKIFSELAR